MVIVLSASLPWTPIYGEQMHAAKCITVPVWPGYKCCRVQVLHFRVSFALLKHSHRSQKPFSPILRTASHLHKREPICGVFLLYHGSKDTQKVFRHKKMMRSAVIRRSCLDHIAITCPELESFDRLRRRVLKWHVYLKFESHFRPGDDGLSSSEGKHTCGPSSDRSAKAVEVHQYQVNQV